MITKFDSSNQGINAKIHYDLILAYILSLAIGISKGLGLIFSSDYPSYEITTFLMILISIIALIIVIPLWIGMISSLFNIVKLEKDDIQNRLFSILRSIATLLIMILINSLVMNSLSNKNLTFILNTDQYYEWRHTQIFLYTSRYWLQFSVIAASICSALLYLHLLVNKKD